MSGSLVNLLSTFTDLATDQAANDTARMWIHGKIHTLVQDPQVAEGLCPQYQVGTKP